MTTTAVTAGRAGTTRDRVAVIDVGSNSIRLVVFDGLKRAFLPLFNEKVICGLGRSLETTGRLSQDGVDSALVNLVRFVAMARAMKVDELHMVATAAARDAENGADFVAEVERRCECPVRILSNVEEARLSAVGVLTGLPDSDGVMGDLGGGSLELVSLDRGRLGSSHTLPLGALRLIDTVKAKPKQAVKLIDRRLDEVSWLEEMKGRDFYTVGGAWRNLARLHMAHAKYHLHVLHGYTLAGDEAEAMAELVAGLGKRSIAQIEGISKRRAETLPYAALLLSRLLWRCRPARLVVSAYGLREGLMLERIAADQRALDPLIEAATELGCFQGRFGGFGDALTRWTDVLFPGEPPAMRRLREAACHLSDLAWREHPDYRAEHALRRILHYPFMAVDHPGRAFVALAVSTRYAGGALPVAAESTFSLLAPREMHRAKITGLALRLAYTLSGGVPSLLDKVHLLYAEGKLSLELPSDGSVPSGEIVERRLQALMDATQSETDYELA